MSLHLDQDQFADVLLQLLAKWKEGLYVNRLGPAGQDDVAACMESAGNGLHFAWLSVRENRRTGRDIDATMHQVDLAASVLRTCLLLEPNLNRRQYIELCLQQLATVQERHHGRAQEVDEVRATGRTRSKESAPAQAAA